MELLDPKSVHSKAALDLAWQLSDAPKLPKPKPDESIPSINAVVQSDLGSLKSIAETNPDDLNAIDSHGNSALIYAADQNKLDIVQFLVTQSTVQLTMRGLLGNSAFSRACCCGHTEVVAALLDAAGKRGISLTDLNTPNDKLQYPMHFAAFKLKPDVLRLLLHSGVNSYVIDRKGRTPLEDTSSEEIKDIIKTARAQKEQEACKGKGNDEGKGKGCDFEGKGKSNEQDEGKSKERERLLLSALREGYGKGKCAWETCPLRMDGGNANHDHKAMDHVMQGSFVTCPFCGTFVTLFGGKGGKGIDPPPPSDKGKDCSSSTNTSSDNSDSGSFHNPGR